MHLPLNASPDDPRWAQRKHGNRLLITGAAGAAATLIAEHLAPWYDLIGIDIAPPQSDDFHEFHQCDLSNVDRLHELIGQADYVLHLATGASDGVAGVAAVDVDATSRILASAIHHGTRRVLLASSTHAVGWYERELIAGTGDGMVHATSPLRPDGMYGAAKAQMELLADLAYDSSGLPVSVLRIGTMSNTMTMQEMIDSRVMSYLGFGEFRAERFRRSWLTGKDFATILQEELSAEASFRLRFATSSPEQTIWNHDVLIR